MYYTLDSHMNFIYQIYMECIILPGAFHIASKMKQTTKK